MEPTKLYHFHIFYFNLERCSSLAVVNSTFTWPHRPAPAIPNEKPLNLNQNNQITENVYLAAKEIRQSLIKEEEEEDDDDDDDDNKFKILQSKRLEEETPLEDKVKEKKI